MFVHLLFFVCACAGLGRAQEGTTEKPGDISWKEEIEKAAKLLEDNVLSMSGNIPLLNDSRRQYAEIVHVVHKLGQDQSGCIPVDYFETYQEEVNASAPEGLANPQLVIDEVNELIAKYNEKTHGNNDLAKELLELGGLAAKEMIKNAKKFAEVSEIFAADQYLSTAAKELEDHVKALGDFYRLLNSPTC